MEEEAADLLGAQAAGRWLLPGIECLEIDGTIDRRVVDRQLDLEHASLVVLAHLAHSLVVFEDDPLECGVRVREVGHFALPVANWITAVHEVDKHVLHLIYSRVGRLDDSLLEALAEPVVPLLVLLGPVRGHLELTNLDHDLVVCVIGGQGDTTADLSNEFILLLLVELEVDGLLLDRVFEHLRFSLRVLHFFGLDLHQDATLPGGAHLRLVIHQVTG